MIDLPKEHGGIAYTSYSSKMNLKFVASLVACFVNLTVAQKIMTFRRVDDPDGEL